MEFFLLHSMQTIKIYGLISQFMMQSCWRTIVKAYIFRHLSDMASTDRKLNTKFGVRITLQADH